MAEAEKILFRYNLHGNVDTLLQDYGKSTGNPNAMNTTGHRFKKIVYEYDLISGKVNAVNYQPGKTDAFYHRNSYDAENRLVEVETSFDQLYWERDARYSYYRHGPLARSVLGQLQVQGIDYAYTLQGWLKGINSTSVGDGSFDMGQDGKPGSPNSNIARDAYGMSLHYFTGDYKPINATVTPFAGISVGNDLFNGNIKAMVVNIPKLGDALSYGFKYDQLNRLVAMDAYNGLNNATNTFTPVSINDYKERLSYDANGNIKTYLRNSETGAAKNNYQYTYTANSNRLASITNTVNSQTKTYSYDEIGNTTADGMQGMTNAIWNVYGKLQSATNKDGANVTYTYAADGQRISKKVGAVEEWYVKDASGHTMATYKKDASIHSGHVSTTEFYKYGSGILSIKNHVVDMEVPPSLDGITTFVRGEDGIILSDYLGNTRVVITDKKLPVQDPANPSQILYYLADVKTATHYSSYGAIANQYGQTPVVAFNGQRKSTEIGADAQTALYWEYNGDVGRRNNLDPRPNVSLSTYTVFSNSPIWISDGLGDTPRVQMNGADYSLVRGKDNKLKYVDARGADYTGNLSTNATNLMSGMNTSLSSGSPNLVGRANTILNSKFDLFIRENDDDLPSGGGDGLFAYKLSDGTLKHALPEESQPTNAIGAYISLSGSKSPNIQAKEGIDIRYSSGKSINDPGGLPILQTMHEIFGHGWQAINRLMGPDRIQNWSGGTLLGAPRKVEADAVTITNMFAIHAGLAVQKIYLEQEQNSKGEAYKIYHKVPWGFLLGTFPNALLNFPETKK